MTWSALITPFREDGTLDKPGFARNLALQKEAGVTGLLVLGTTGESPTLNMREKEWLVAQAKETGLPLMVGCGANCTATTIDNVRFAEKWGADFALLISPYYNRPTDEGLFAHFDTIAQATSLPLVLYNHPGRTQVNLRPEIVLRLLPRVVAIKEVSGNLDQVCDLLPHLEVYGGDDSQILPMMALGASGILSVAANLIPEKVVALVRACGADDMKLARKLHFELLPFFRATCWQTNPIPIKAAMDFAQLPAGKPRLPLTELAACYHEPMRHLVDRL